MRIFSLLVLLATVPTSFIRSGDEAFELLDYDTAIRNYAAALESSPRNTGALWRLARVYVCAGEVDSALGNEWFTQAESAARECFSIDSLCWQAYTWHAGALGYLALNAGAGDQVRLVSEMKKSLDRALSLNPLDDAAYSIQGSLYRALGNVGWFRRTLASMFVGDLPEGGFQEAETSFLHAIRLRTDVMRHHYELGVLYLDSGQKKKAREVLLKAASLPVLVAIDRYRLLKIQSLLTELSPAK